MSPYVADCVKHFPRLTSQQEVVLGYAFDQEKEELSAHSHLELHYCCVSYSMYSSCLAVSTFNYLL